MKNSHLKHLLLFVSSIIFFDSCQQDQAVVPSQGKATFSFTTGLRSGGRVGASGSPAYVLISIKDSHAVVQENVKLSMYPFGQGYVSENLELVVGDYQLTKYSVLNSSNKILYATPIEGSSLAKYVTDPLAISFTITNQGTQVNPQVIEVLDDDQPELFGYTDFKFDVVEYARVRKVTFDGIGVEDTLSFFYSGGKISSVNWCTHLEGATSSNNCLVSYSEIRNYDPIGTLAEISGRWHVIYLNENGLRKRSIAYYDNQYFSSTNFLYEGNQLSKVKVHFAESDINDETIVDLTFDSSGDLIRQVMQDRNGTVLADIKAEYSNLVNPLHGVIETISYAVEFFDYNSFIFYHSKHVPKTVTNSVAALPGHPVLQHSILYEYQQDATGRLIVAKALVPNNGNSINVHNILIDYAE